jgi:hypothetical protein
MYEIAIPGKTEAWPPKDYKTHKAILIYISNTYEI